MLPFTPDDPRVRHLNDRPVVAGGEFVVYWSQIYRRAEDNAALAYAVFRANELGLPCIVYEALRPDYPHANDRLHTFVLEAARDTAKRLLERGIHHAFFLPRTPADARGIVRKLAARAALIVSDDFPSFIVPAQNAAAAKHAPCSFVVVDDCTVVPLSLFPKEESAARTLRPKFSRVSAYWLDAIDDPAPRFRPPRRLDLPFDPIDWKHADIPKLVASCQIDHTVASVPEFPGGTTAAEARLELFLRRALPSYDADRSDPSRDRTSHLSPYLHFGIPKCRYGDK